MFMVQGLKAVNLYHMRTQLAALKLEIAGIRHSRGSVYAHIKKAYGLRGTKQRVYDQFSLLVEEASRQ